MKTFNFIPKLFIVLMILSTAACESIQLTPPQVSVLKIRPSNSGGFDLEFFIDLKISNPNSIALPVNGMSYSISLNNAKVLQGVSNSIPTIPAYGSQYVTVSISSNLLSAPKLLVNLLKNPSSTIQYELNGKIDLEGLLPSFNIVEKGEVPLEKI